jgi:uncharacterized membrane protein
MASDSLTKLGRALTGVAITAFGIQFFIYAGSVTTLAPSWPRWMVLQPASVLVLGVVLTVFGLTLLLRPYARFAALLVGIGAVVWVLAANLPPILRNPGDIGIWNNGVMNVGLAGCAFLAGCATLKSSFGKAGRILLAAALIVFGAEHFYYARFVATLVPAWMPAHYFWGIATGVALVAAGISFGCGRWMHLAALLSAVMFLLWVVAVHAPRLIPARHSADEWTSLFHAVAFAGASLVLAGMTGPKVKRQPVA